MSHSADHLLDGLGKGRSAALELLFRLVKVDPEGRRHTRQRMRHAEAIAIAGGGERGLVLVNRLAGERARDGGRNRGPLRLITVTEEATAANGAGADADTGKSRWVNLIHETLIRSKGLDARGRPQPYWPTLWNYIEANKDRAARRERLRLQAREWKKRKGLARLFALAGWSGVVAFRGLAGRGSCEQRYLRWSLGSVSVQAVVLVCVLGAVGESLYWAKAHDLPLEAIGTHWAHKLGKPLPFLELVRIPPGRVPLPHRFLMGSESGSGDELPVHPVTIAEPFYLGATEVTFTQYGAFCDATGRYRPDDATWSRDKRPAIYVGWNDARAYAGWMDAMTGSGCRLPSEAEWEYATRAGTTTEYALPAPDDIADKGLANCRSCGSDWDGDKTAPVSSFDSNAWGLQDMHGNVWEWVEDCWHQRYYDAPKDVQAWLEKNGGECRSRVLRGGSWYNNQGYARSAFRGRLDPNYRNFNVGFRVLCSSPIFDH